MSPHLDVPDSPVSFIHSPAVAVQPSQSGFEGFPSDAENGGADVCYTYRHRNSDAKDYIE